jgi:hypothetical protein
MATYQRPFLGDSIYEIFNSIINDEAPSIINLYSKDLNKILKRFPIFIFFRKKILYKLMIEYFYIA